MNDTNQFYAELTPFYHLIYPDWDTSIKRQASMLAFVIKERWGDASTVLDVSCGIGTQAIGLAQLGYNTPSLRDCKAIVDQLNEDDFAVRCLIDSVDIIRYDGQSTWRIKTCTLAACEA